LAHLGHGGNYEKNKFKLGIVTIKSERYGVDKIEFEVNKSTLT